MFVHPGSNAEKVTGIISDYAQANPDEKIIVARGFGMQVKAHRRVLDEVVSDRPV